LRIRSSSTWQDERRWRARHAVVGVLVAAIATCSLALASTAQADPLDLVPPVASISATPNPAATGDLVTFDASGSTDIDGTITKYEWDLDGNGSFETDTGAQASATASYFSPGTVTVQVRVSDTGEPSPNTDQAQVDVVIKGPPNAAFDVSPASPKTDDTITLTSTSSDTDGSIVSQDWDLDNDGLFDDASGSSVSTSFSTGGTYQIRLLVTDNDGLTAIATDSVTVSNRAPVASFDFSPTDPQAGQTITFTSSSSDPDGSIASQDWDLDNDGEFDDASGSSAQWAFGTPGSKTVRLQVIDDNNTTSVATLTVPVANRPPTASFDVAPEAPISGQTVVFTSTSNDPDGQALTYAWDTNDDGAFDDGTGSSASRSFPTPGSQTVRLRVTDSSGASDTFSFTFTVANRPPTANFTYSPATPLTAQPVTFTSSSTDPDGTIAANRTEWDFNNDGIFEKTGTSAQNTFAVPGAYVITLKVTDANGASDSIQKTIVTENRPPTAAFSFAPASPTTGQVVTFTNSSTDPNGTIVAYRWDFDNNGTVDSNLASPTSTYAKSGTYTVDLEVVDNNGATNVAQKAITVSNRAPTAGFTNAPAAPQTNDVVTFTSTSVDPDGTVKVYQWDFGDGVKQNGENIPVVAHAYTTSGSKSVKLTVVDDLGRSSTTFTKTITINNRPPQADFINSPAFPNPFETVTFNASTSGDVDGTIAKYEWDLDNDGLFDDDTADGTADKTATRKFNESGAFTVRLKVTDDKGASTIAAQTVFIGNRAPVASFGFSPSQPTAGQAVTLYSTAGDPDSPITGYGWDLDGNGVYSDASGSTVTREFSAGSHNVGLLVTDSEGASSFAIQTVNVASPSAAVPAGRAASPRLMSPFPLVRIAGTIHRRGSKLRRLTVTAPTGATVVIRCHGRSCPFGRQSRVVKSEKTSRGRQPTVRAVRIRRFEHKLLRAGTMIRVFITKPGTIGKYTQFKIRARRAPVRTDRCLAQGSSKPIDCPTS
jgi:PKD repeat protein